MAFWSDWFRKSATYTTRDLLRDLMGSSESKSGKAVTHETALQATAALACARVIAEGIMQVPFRLMKTDGVNRLPATEHPVSRLFENGPNEWQTTPEFLEMLALHLVFCGNAFVWKNQRKAEILELLPFTPNQVSIKREGWITRYSVTLDGKQTEIPQKDMWHIRGPSWNGYQGLDAIKLARESIGLALAAEEHGAKTFANGAAIAGLLTTTATLNKTQRDELRESWQKVHGGSVNTGKVAVMSNGFTFSPVASNNVDSQWVESRKYQVEEICRALRVMPIMVGYSDKASTYASAEQMFIAHVVHTLSPWYQRIEKSANKFLLNEKDAGHYFKFFANGLMRGSAKDRGEFYRSLYGVGGINPNEIREYEDMNPYEGGEQYRVPLNMADPNAAPEPKPDPTKAAPTHVITVNTPEVKVEGPTVNVSPPNVTVEKSDVTVNTPEITINTPDVKFDPTINVAAPVVTANIETRGATKKSLKYDKDGNISSVIETPVKE